MAKRFNWQGITENNDGTFTAENKRAKIRLLKEFHRQGVSIRSTKIEGDGYRISPTGAITKKSMGRRPALGYRPRTVFPRRIARPAYQRPPPRSGFSPSVRQRPYYPSQPYYGAPPRARRPGVLSRVGGYLQRKQYEGIERHRKEIELKQSLAESRAKMKAEREQEILRNQQRQREIRAQAAGRQAMQAVHSQKPPASTRIPVNAGATTTYETGTGQKVTTSYKPQVDYSALQAKRTELIENK